MRRKHAEAVWLMGLFSLLAVGCAASETGPGPQASPPTQTQTSALQETSHNRKGAPFVARIAISKMEVPRDSDLEVIILIENRSQDPLIFTEEEFTSPNVMFE